MAVIAKARHWMTRQTATRGVIFLGRSLEIVDGGLLSSVTNVQCGVSPGWPERAPWAFRIRTLAERLPMSFQQQVATSASVKSLR